MDISVAQDTYSDKDVVALQIPFTAHSTIANESLVWDYTTVNQADLDNRPLAYQRGRVLGGSSTVSEWETYLVPDTIFKAA